MSEFTTSDEQTIHYEYTPGEDPLVFIHGWVQDLHLWDQEITYFQEQGHATLRIDLRGHGKSSAPKNIEAYTMQRFVDDLHEAITHCKLENPTLIGHSLGGMIALSYVKEHHPKRLVLIDSSYENPSKHVPIAKNINWTPITQKLLEYVEEHPEIQQTIGEINDHKHLPELLRRIKQTAPHVILTCLREILKLDQEQILKHIRAPTLLIAGEKDWQTPPSIAKEMHQKIPQSKLSIIPKADHNTPLSHPKEIIQEIESFLEETP